MHPPSPILTMVCPNGETHVEREERFHLEQQRRLMEFLATPAVREITDKIGRELMAEYDKYKKQ
jgi:hypothetical protein